MGAAFRFPPELLSQDVAILGRKGSGKTYTGKGMVEALLDAKRRVCILDPLGVWWGLRSSADGKRPGFPIVVFGGDHADVAIGAESGKALARLLGEKNLPAIVDLSGMLIGERHRFVTDFAEELYRVNRQPLHLFIDEADEFAPQNPMPETKRMLHHVDRIVRRGRVRGFRVTLITQRPAVLHKNVLTQAATLVAMRLTAPQDREAINAWVEGQADKALAKDVLGSLASLKRGEGWVWAPDLGMLERHTFPKIRTFDSSRTPEDDEVLVEPTKLAAVDLTEIRESFAAVEKEAKTLVELKAEVARLTEAAKRNVGVVDKPAVLQGHTDAQVQQLVAAEAFRWMAFDVTRLAALRQILTLATEAVDRALPSSPRLTDDQEQQVADFVWKPGKVTKTTEIGVGTGGDAKLTQRVVFPEPVTVRKGEAIVVRVFGDGATMTPPQARIVDALAQLEAFGVPMPHKGMVAAFSGASPKSSGFANNLGALRSKGLIDYPSGGLVQLTGEGRAIARYPDKPPTLEDLQRAWLALLPAPQQRIVQALISCYPQAMLKGQLAEAAGASPSSSGYANNLGALRSLGILNYPSVGLVAATPLLFPKGKK